MSTAVVYRLKVWSSLAEGDAPYFEFETDNELHLIREILRAVDNPFMARFSVTKGVVLIVSETTIHQQE